MEQVSCPTSGRLPAYLDIRYGPRALLGRFFLAADAAARERGVSLHFASFDDLLAANADNHSSWRPLTPLFTPRLSGVSEHTGFAILGRNAVGEIVAAQAARVFDWPNTTLRAEAESLRMFYADPEAARTAGNHCEVTAASAQTISGRVVFSGAGWYRPDFRGKGLAGILPRISRLLAFAFWNTEFTTAMMADGVVAGGFAARTGYTKIAHDSVTFELSPVGAFRGAFLWMDTSELLSDAEVALGNLAGASDAGIAAQGVIAG